jgi:hypothetical protein
LRFDDRYLLPDRLVAGPAFYEAIAAAYRPRVGRDFESVVGKEGLEGAIRALLQEHGIAYFAGGYGTEDLECDAVFESRSAVVFIEAKKKGLTRRALAGDAEKVLIDVSSSVLAAHAQLARHELSLRSNGEMRFEDGKVLRLEGRDVIRVGITLLDLGSFQDKVVLGKMIRLLRGARLRSTRQMTDADRKSVEAFGKTADSLLQSYDALDALDPDWTRRERFGLKSYSLPQFMVLLSDAPSPDALVVNLTVDTHLTTSTGDWLAEYRSAKETRSTVNGPA